MRKIDRDVGVRHLGDAMGEVDVGVDSRLGLFGIAHLLAEEVDRHSKALFIEAPSEFESVIYPLASDVAKRPPERGLPDERDRSRPSLEAVARSECEEEATTHPCVRHREIMSRRREAPSTNHRRTLR